MGKNQCHQLQDQIANLPADQSRVILATGRYLGEGFDDERLDTLFLALPISWRGTLTQYAGRLHRLNAAKKEVIIYDAQVVQQLTDRLSESMFGFVLTWHYKSGQPDKQSNSCRAV